VREADDFVGNCGCLAQSLMRTYVSSLFVPSSTHKRPGCIDLGRPHLPVENLLTRGSSPQPFPPPSPSHSQSYTKQVRFILRQIDNVSSLKRIFITHRKGSHQTDNILLKDAPSSLIFSYHPWIWEPSRTAQPARRRKSIKGRLRWRLKRGRYPSNAGSC
jgi:hypothetical protein